MAYKHSRWNSGRSTARPCANRCSEYSKQTTHCAAECSNNSTGSGTPGLSAGEKLIFLKPPKQVGKVISAMNDYLHKLDIMKLSKQTLLKSVVEMFPEKWHNRHELSIYMDDQAEIWQLTREVLRPLMDRLKEYEIQISNAQEALDNYHLRLDELESMIAEYENMKKKGKIPKIQANQIIFMVKESERAMILIKADTEKKLLTFLRSREDIAKEFLEKFEDALHVTYSESLQIVDLITGIVGGIPKRKLNPHGHAKDDVELVTKLLEKRRIKTHVEYTKESMATMKPILIDHNQSQGDRQRSSVSKHGNSNANSQSVQNKTPEDEMPHDQHRMSSETTGMQQSQQRRRTSTGPAHSRESRESSSRQPSSVANPARECEPQDVHTSKSEQRRQSLCPITEYSHTSTSSGHSEHHTSKRESVERRQCGSCDGPHFSAKPDPRRLPYRTRTLQINHRTCEPVTYRSVCRRGKNTTNSSYAEEETNINDNRFRYERQMYQESQEDEQNALYADNHLSSRKKICHSGNIYATNVDHIQEHNTPQKYTLPTTDYDH